MMKWLVTYYLRSEMKTYLDFQKVEEKQTTIVYDVVSKTQGAILGTIKWYAAWRQYCYFPKGDTVFSGGCLSEIRGFIEGLMERRKSER